MNQILGGAPLQSTLFATIHIIYKTVKGNCVWNAISIAKS